MSSLPPQVGGSHYMDCKIRPVSFIEANNLKFLEGSVVKRMCRHDKPTGKGRQDIEKAIHELQLLLELRYGSATPSQFDTYVKHGLVYTKCPHCKEVTRAKIGTNNNRCEQCGAAFTLTIEHFNEERMDVIGQNGNDGEHYEKPWIPHEGGPCPVPPGVRIDVRYRNGAFARSLPTGGGLTGPNYWAHDGTPGDVVAYRLA